MKIALFGSTGQTGQEVVKQALKRDYGITTLVRELSGIYHPDVIEIEGDIFDVDAVRDIIRDCDVVISVLGFTPSFLGRKSTDIYSRMANVFIEAMDGTAVKKLIFCTSAGVEEDRGETWVYKNILKPFVLKKSYTDMKLAEKIITESDLDWILVRPAQLTNDELTSHFRVSGRFRPKGGSTISRADLAFFILNQVPSNAWVRQTPTLSY